MSEQHVFIHDNIKVEHKQIRGGKGKAICRQMLNADDIPAGSPFTMAAVNILPPGCSIAVHKHEGNAEAYLIMSGSGAYTGRDGKVVRVKVGDVTICYDGEIHGLENDTQEPLQIGAFIAAK
ncbi:MAG: cupin domain-containing protein [Deltaproteobacteria bacterium]|jgi:gentisate 1,2-dioxygenase|nr:cupin domain-containing protein [Deltaproteobacteria bacterium]